MLQNKKFRRNVKLILKKDDTTKIIGLHKSKSSDSDCVCVCVCMQVCEYASVCMQVCVYVL